MLAQQNAKLNMYRVIEKLVNDNPQIVALTPAFQTAFNQFKAQIATITELIQQTDLKISGIVSDKDSLKHKLCQIATNTANSIFAFASTIENHTLKEEMNFTISKLKQTRSDQLPPRCQNIHDRGREFETQLQDYGVNDAILKTLQKAINDYSVAVPNTRSAVSHRKSSLDSLSAAFKNADNILQNRMDKLIGTFQAENPEFVAVYKAGRIIIDAARTITQLKGTITKQADGMPIKNVTVLIVELNSQTLSDSQGNYFFKPLKAGKYTVRFSAEGFQTQELDAVEVKLGTIKTLNVRL